MPVLQWNEITTVNTLTGSSQDNPDVAVLSDGRYVIVWSTTFGDETIRGQMFNADGTPFGGEFIVDSTPDGENNFLFNPDVVALPDGGFVVALRQGTNTAGESDVRLARYDANGIQTEVIDATTGARDFVQPDLVVVGNQVWLGSSQISNTGDLNATITIFNLDADGGLSLTTQAVANSDLTGNQQDVDFAILNNGNIATVWSEGNNVIELRLFDSSLNALTADIVVESNAGTLSGPDPEVMALSNGGFLVVWKTNDGNVPANALDVRGQIYAANGVAVGTEFVINTQTVGGQFNVVTTQTNDGGFAAFWLNTEGDASIEGQLFDAQGNFVDMQFTAVSEVDPALSVDDLDADTLPDGRIVLTWGDSSIDGSARGIASVILDPRDGDVQGSNLGETLFGSILDDQIQALDDDDILFGLDGDDELDGQNGDDILDGGLGSDVLNGGNGFDVATYADSATAVVASLFTGTGNAGAAGDTYFNIEGLIGSDFNDLLIGRDGASDTLRGGDGSDALRGNGGDDFLFGDAGGDLFFSGFGADAHDGGTGIDTVLYNLAGAGVIVNLTSGTGAIGQAAGDTYISVENVVGTAFADLIVGAAGTNVLQGRAGNDILDGRGGADVLNGGNNFDTVTYASSNAGVLASLFTGTGSGGHAQGDTYIDIEALTGSAFDDLLVGRDGASDTLRGGDGSDALRGNGGDDFLFGDAGGDLFFSGFGADAHDGGAGIDTILYNQANAGVVVNLSSGTGAIGHAAGDTYTSIENVVGTAFGDFIVGSATGNTLQGRAGNDTLDGRGGADILIGGNNADTFIFAAGYGTDRIADFSEGDGDIINLSSFNFSNFQALVALMTQDGADTVINFGNGDALRLADIDFVDLEANDFII